MSVLPIFTRSHAPAWERNNFVAIYLVHNASWMTLGKIGAAFGVSNFSTVSSASERIKRRMATDACLRQEVEKLKQHLDKTPAILIRLGIDAEMFISHADNLLREFGGALGTPDNIVELTAVRQNRYL